MMEFLPVGAPALPLDEAGKYVAAAYIVFVVLILLYVAIMAAKLQRLERELRELAGFAEQRRNGDAQAAPGRGGEAPSVVGSATPGESGGGV
jgi:hypothetical protein